jgi:hypothetical protein
VSPKSYKLNLKHKQYPLKRSREKSAELQKDTGK